MKDERCQRCGEVGQDRRTLHMACLYDMSELNVPFTECIQRDPITKNVTLREHRLKVCEGCWGDWLLAIEKWFLDNHNKREETMESKRVTHEQAKAAICALLGLVKECNEWEQQYSIVARYVNQEPEDVDMEIWTEIELLLEDENMEGCLVFGIGDGLWGLFDPNSKSLSATIPAVYAPRALLSDIRKFMQLKPTLETEQVAHQETRKKLSAANSQLQDLKEFAAQRGWRKQ